MEARVGRRSVIRAEVCPVTGVAYLECRPEASESVPPVPLVALLNGIGLDREGFRGALAALESPPPGYPYRHSPHVALTVPGFEDELDRRLAPLLSMAQQAARVAAFLGEHARRLGAPRLVLYGFSFGSDLLVEVLQALEEAGPPVERAVFTELNVHEASCFITRRITAAYDSAEPTGQGRHRQAYSGFVQRILDAYSHNLLSSRTMHDMTHYFHTIFRKDWHQMAQSAREASADPAARTRRLLDRLARFPETRVDVVFCDPEDLRAFQRLCRAHPGPLGALCLLDQTLTEHFHHMSAAGVLENLRGALPESPWA